MTYENLVSSDSHVREPIDLWWKTIGKRFGERTPRLIHEYKGLAGDFFYTGGRVAKYVRTDVSLKLDLEGGNEKAKRARMIVESGYDPHQRIEFQRLAKIRAEVLYPSAFAPVMQCGDAEVAQAAAEVYNDWMAEFCAPAADRLIGIAAIPTYDPKWAIKELGRVRAKGLRGAFINTVVPEGVTPYRTKSWDVFWSTAQALDMPVILHIITGRVLDPLLYGITKEDYEHGPRDMIEIFNEIQGTVANEFVFGQILDRFPTLKVVEAEWEVSWLPLFMFRLDQMQQDFTPLMDLPKLKLRASEYIKTRIWHGMTDDPYGIHAIKEVGSDQVLWGSDFPHIRSRSFDTQEFVAELFAPLTPNEQAKVIGDNATRVFKS